MTRFARLAAGLSAGLIFSRVLGLLRDMLTAWLLGAGPLADALAVAMRLPHVMRRLLGEGALSMTITADAIRSAQQARPERGACALPLLALLLTIAGEALAPQLTALLAPGLSGETAAQAALLLRICLPYVFLSSLTAVDMAALHASSRFALPAASPALFNIVFIATALSALWLHPGAGQQHMARALAVGLLLGGAAQCALQRAALLRLRGFFSPSMRFCRGLPLRLPPLPQGKRILRLCAGIFGAAGLQLAMLCAMLEASWLPAGTVAALNYAERLAELPMSVAGAAIGMAGLPVMAAMAGSGRHGELACSIESSMRLALFVALPAMAGLMAVSGDLVRALLRYGAFGESSAAVTAMALCAYAPGLPAHALARPLLAACNAQNDVLGPALSTILLLLCSVAAGFAFMALLPENLAAAGPPLGVSLGLWVQAVMLWIVVRRRLAAAGRSLAPPPAWTPALGSLAAAAAALAAGRIMPGPVSGLALSVGAGALAYGAFAIWRGGREMEMLRNAFKKS